MAARRTRSKKPRRAKKPPVHTCDECGRAFKTERGVRAHASQAHKAKERASRSGRTRTAKKAFIEAFRLNGNVTLAATAAGVHRQRPYDWAADDEAFALEWAAAKEHAADLMVEEARRRAVDGVEEPVFWQGQEVGGVRKYSDTLLIFLLKGLRPETYREHHRHEHTGKDGGPIAVTSDPRELSDDELRRIAAAGGDGSRGGAGVGSA